MKIHIFKTKDKNSFGMNKILAIPEDKIASVETYYGSHMIDVKINGIAVEESFDTVISKLQGSKFDINNWIHNA